MIKLYNSIVSLLKFRKELVNPTAEFSVITLYHWFAVHEKKKKKKFQVSWGIMCECVCVILKGWLAR